MSDKQEINQEYIDRVLENKQIDELTELINLLMLDRSYDRRRIEILENKQVFPEETLAQTQVFPQETLTNGETK